MRVTFDDIPDGMTLNDFPDDTILVVDDRPKKFDLSGNKIRIINPNDPDYDKYPDTYAI